MDFSTLPPPEEPADAFAAVVALRRLAASLERSAVDEALSQGWTWAQIGSALDLSAQAAHKRLSPSRRKAITTERNHS
jgi:DNA-directed RNA polymerase specialized sigma24 family protein